MLSIEALQVILGINEKVYLSPTEMADQMNITFFPYIPKRISEQVLRFKEQLADSFTRLRVNVVPYGEALETVSYRKRIRRVSKIILNNLLYGSTMLIGIETPRQFIHFSALRNALRRKRIKRGISVIALGEQKSGNLPMDHTSSFTESSVITILDWPENLRENADFYTHFDTALRLFAYHMTNIVIAVGDETWLLYNFNASHPIYRLDRNDFDQIILQALVPKIVAPIRPVKFEEFEIEQEAFSTDNTENRPYVEDFVKSSGLFKNTGLYPAGRTIDSLPFRNGFYRWIGGIHLDQRNGMSYGFLARQLPVVPSRIIPVVEAKKQFAPYFRDDKDYFRADGKLYILLELIPGERICLEVPDVWVLSQRSGIDKLNVNPPRDLIKLGLIRGRLHLQTPQRHVLLKGHRPSFDTRVILAHAVGNAIIASLLAHYRPQAAFGNTAVHDGFAIVHWHGYFHPKHIPKNFYVHG